jgi:hypothetical protein
MKTKSVIFKIAPFILVITLLLFTGYVTDPGAGASTDLTKNSELKTSVFNQIISNRELFTEFMNNMMQNPQSMQWMMNDQGMVQYMFSGNHLGYMMHHNQGMSRLMMQNMMNTIQADSTYCYQWNQMMNESNGMHHRNMMNNSPMMHYGGMMN